MDDDLELDNWRRRSKAGRLLGRPRGRDSQARTRELLRQVASGRSLRDAAREARVDAERVLDLYADPSFRRAVNALLDDRIAT